MQDRGRSGEQAVTHGLRREVEEQEAMARVDVAHFVDLILGAHDPHRPKLSADALCQLWLQFDPKSVAGIKAE